MARSSARADHQLTFGPLPSKRVATDADGCKKVKNVELVEAFRLTGQMIDAAREAAHITRQEACGLMFIDEARYSRWVHGSPADTVSLARLLLLPPELWIELLPKIHELKGLRQRAIARFLNSAIDLALTVER
jgi:hypothetical protein